MYEISRTFTASEDGYIILKSSIDDGYFDFTIDGIIFRHTGNSEWFSMIDTYEIYPIRKRSVASCSNINANNLNLTMYFAPMIK